MPTYDYQCRSCGVISEVVHSMLEEGPTTCERCGGQLRRLVHPTGIIFKGSGFYKTDSRSPSSGNAGGSSQGSSTPAADSSSGKTSGDGGGSPKATGSTSSGEAAAKGPKGSD